MVSSMSILCLWDIQVTFDRVEIETHGAYHRKSELKRVQEFLKSDIRKLSESVDSLCSDDTHAPIA